MKAFSKTIALLVLSFLVCDADARGRRSRPTGSFEPSFNAPVEVANVGESVDALDEVNAARAARGLRPFVKCPLLTEGAKKVAAYRAAHGISGHTGNDFAFLPEGAWAPAAGCAAWPVGAGFGSCCIYEGWTYCGAAYCVRGGTRFMHVYVK